MIARFPGDAYRTGVRPGAFLMAFVAIITAVTVEARGDEALVLQAQKDKQLTQALKSADKAEAILAELSLHLKRDHRQFELLALAARCIRAKVKLGLALHDGRRLIQGEQDVQRLLRWCAHQPAILGEWNAAKGELQRMLIESGFTPAVDILSDWVFELAEYNSLAEMGNQVAARIARGKSPQEVAIPFFDNRGGPYERGVAHGRVFSQQIRDGYDFWCRKGVADATAFNLAVKDRIVAYVGERFPEVMQELRGIADGSGLTIDQIVWLNTFNSVIKIKQPQNCSSVVLRGSDGAMRLGTTADIDPDQRRMMLLRRVRDGKRDFYVVGWFGTVWVEMALTRSGLAIGADSAPTQPGQDGSGIGQHFGAYPVLFRADTVEQAIDNFSKIQFAGKGLIFGLADASGDGAILEKSGTAQGVIRIGPSEDGILGTNEFQCHALRKFNRNRPPEFLKYCQDRRDRFAQWLPQTRSVAPVEAIKRLFSTEPFCQSGRDVVFITEAAAISAPRARVIEVTGLSPASRIYVSWSFDD